MLSSDASLVADNNVDVRLASGPRKNTTKKERQLNGFSLSIPNCISAKCQQQVDECSVSNLSHDKRAECAQYIPCPFIAAAYKYGLVPNRNGRFTLDQTRNICYTFQTKEGESWSNRISDVILAN